MQAVVVGTEAPAPPQPEAAPAAQPTPAIRRPGMLTKALKFTQMVAGSSGPVVQGSDLLVKWSIENTTFMPKRFQVIIEDHGPGGAVTTQSTGKEVLRGRNSIGGIFRFQGADLGMHQVIGRLLQAPPIILTFEQDRRVLAVNFGGAPVPMPGNAPSPSPTAPGARRSGITTTLNVPQRGAAPANIPAGLVADGPRSVKSPETGICIQW